MSRCPNCGITLDSAGAGCPACGTCTPASAGAIPDRNYPLAPMPVGSYDIPLGPSETLVAAVRMWKRDWGRLMVLAAIPLLFGLPFIVALVVLAFLLDGQGEPPLSAMITVVGLSVVSVLILMVGHLASIGAIIAHVDERERAGAATLSVWQSFLHGLSKAGRLFVSVLATFGVPTLSLGLVVGPAIIGALEKEPLVIALMIPGVILVPFAIWLTLRLAPLWVVVVVEDISLRASFSRAFSLTRGRAGTIFLCALTYAAIAAGVSMVAGVLSLIPLLGLLSNVVLQFVIASIGPVWQHALYAGLVRESQQGRSAQFPAGTTMSM